MSRELGVPDRVLTVARERGVHNDCLVADIQSACPQCRELMMSTMFEIYGGSQDPIGEIMADLLAEDA